MKRAKNETLPECRGERGWRHSILGLEGVIVGSFAVAVLTIGTSLVPALFRSARAPLFSPNLREAFLAADPRQFVVDRASRMTGKVVDASGAPCVDVELVVMAAVPRPRAGPEPLYFEVETQGRSREDGSFLFQDLRYGLKRVVALAPEGPALVIENVSYADGTGAENVLFQFGEGTEVECWIQSAGHPLAQGTLVQVRTFDPRHPFEVHALGPGGLLVLVDHTGQIDGRALGVRLDDRGTWRSPVRCPATDRLLIELDEACKIVPGFDPEIGCTAEFAEFLDRRGQGEGLKHGSVRSGRTLDEMTRVGLRAEQAPPMQSGFEPALAGVTRNGSSSEPEIELAEAQAVKRSTAFVRTYMAHMPFVVEDSAGTILWGITDRFGEAPVDVANGDLVGHVWANLGGRAGDVLGIVVDGRDDNLEFRRVSVAEVPGTVVHGFVRGRRQVAPEDLRVAVIAMGITRAPVLNKDGFFSAVVVQGRPFQAYAYRQSTGAIVSDPVNIAPALGGDGYRVWVQLQLRESSLALPRAVIGNEHMIRVTLVSEESSHDERREDALIDGEGNWIIPHLTPGSYLVQAVGDGGVAGRTVFLGVCE